MSYGFCLYTNVGTTVGKGDGMGSGVVYISMQPMKWIVLLLFPSLFLVVNKQRRLPYGGGHIDDEFGTGDIEDCDSK